MEPISEYTSEKGDKIAIVWFNSTERMFYVDFEEYGTFEKKFKFLVDAEEYAEDYVLGEIRY
jgi:hypothetical protein